MILGIDPKVDYVFKYLLGRESTHALLIDVLNKVLELGPGHEIQEIKLLNPYNLQEAPDDKLSILDIKARDQSGRQFNIEMQMLASLNYKERILFYWSRLYQEPIHEGDEYERLRPTISINFLNHVLFPQVPAYHLRFRLLEETHHFPMTENIEFHFLELPKFKKGPIELKTGLDRWLYFLRFAEKMDTEALPATLKQPTILHAVEELRMLTQTDIERERYESRLKAQRDHYSAMALARQEGEKIGQDIGLKKGQEIGQKVGELMGTIHLCEQILQLPETPEDQLLGLSLENLARLADERKKQALNR